jgi:uncharacterized delta-60 repeat protein
MTARPARIPLCEPLELRRLLSVTLSGTAWTDANGDGVRNNGEAAKVDFGIYCDLNGNNIYDSNEPQTGTGVGGAYTFTGLAAGTYAVRPKVTGGYRQTFPLSAASHLVTLADGQSATGKDFGVLYDPTARGQIRGRLLLDNNGDGVIQSGEAGLAGRTVYIDMNANRRFDAGVDRSTTTDAGGTYLLTDVPYGSATVMHDMSGGYKAAVGSGSNAPREQATTVYAGQTTVVPDLLTTPFTRSKYVDPTFAISGVFGPRDRTSATSMAVTAGGKYLVSGFDGMAKIFRFNADGTPDLTFGTFGDGAARIPNSVGFYGTGQLTVDGAGRILVANGASRIASPTVLRLLPDGSVDTTFGTNGVASVTLPNYSVLVKLVAQPDGRVVMLCEELDAVAPTVTVLARLTAAGQPDTSFSGDGVYRFDAYPNYEPIDVAVDSAGRPLVTAGYRYGGKPPLLARLNTAGALDTTFNGTGVVNTTQPGVGGKVITDSLNRVVLAATTTGGVLVNRFLANGLVDTSFGTAASNVATYTRAGGTAVQFPQAEYVALAPDGGILVAGQVDSTARFNYDIGIARFKPNGGLDTAFASGGRFTAAFGDRHDFPQGLAALAGGKVVVAATFNNNLALLRFDGSAANPPLSISGVIFDDRDWDGVRDAGEGPLAGQTVYADANNDGVMQSTERAGRSNALGGYAITGLAAGAYRVRFVTDGQYHQTLPGGGPFPVVTLTTQSATDANVSAIDSTRPQVTAASVNLATAPNSIRLTFSEDVSASLTLGDWLVESVDPVGNRGRFTTNAFKLDYDKASNTATISFVGDTQRVLRAGDYRFTLYASAVTDRSGNPLASQTVLDFFTFPGDATRDRTVNFADLLTLAKNYNTAGKTFDEGDFDGDGFVNFADLLILAKAYNKTFPYKNPTPSAAASAVTSAAAVAAAAPPVQTVIAAVEEENAKPVFSTTPVRKPVPSKSQPAARPTRR